MSTARRSICWEGDSITQANTDTAGGGAQAKFHMARPDLISTGLNIHRTLNASGTAVITNLFTGLDGKRSVNYGTNGADIGYITSHLAGAVPSMVPVTPPDFFNLHIGINDINAGTSAATCLSLLGTCLNTHNSVVPGAKVFVAQIIGETYMGGAFNSVIAAYNAGIPALVAARSSYCYLVTMPALDPSDYADLQGVHPNSRGYQKMANAWLAGYAAAGV